MSPTTPETRFHLPRVFLLCNFPLVSSPDGHPKPGKRTFNREDNRDSKRLIDLQKTPLRDTFFTEVTFSLVSEDLKYLSESVLLDGTPLCQVENESVEGVGGALV